MRILFYNRRQHIKEKEFQVMFASDAPKRLKKFSGHAVSAGEILFSILHCDYCSLCLDSSQRTSKERLLVKIGYQPVHYRDPLERNPNTPQLTTPPSFGLLLPSDVFSQQWGNNTNYKLPPIRAMVQQTEGLTTGFTVRWCGIRDLAQLSRWSRARD